jgi:hypothetical protein
LRHAFILKGALPFFRVKYCPIRYDANNEMPHSAIFQDKSIEIFKKVNAERSIPRLKDWRTEALRNSHDLYIERSAILFLTPDAPWLIDAPWGIFLPLKNVFCGLKDQGPLNIFKIGGNVEFLKAYKLIQLKLPLSCH